MCQGAEERERARRRRTALDAWARKTLSRFSERERLRFLAMRAPWNTVHRNRSPATSRHTRKRNALPSSRILRACRTSPFRITEGQIYVIQARSSFHPFRSLSLSLFRLCLVSLWLFRFHRSGRSPRPLLLADALPLRSLRRGVLDRGGRKENSSVESEESSPPLLGIFSAARVFGGAHRIVSSPLLRERSTRRPSSP